VTWIKPSKPSRKILSIRQYGRNIVFDPNVVLLVISAHPFISESIPQSTQSLAVWLRISREDGPNLGMRSTFIQLHEGVVFFDSL